MKIKYADHEEHTQSLFVPARGPSNDWTQHNASRYKLSQRCVARVKVAKRATAWNSRGGLRTCRVVGLRLVCDRPRARADGGDLSIN